MWCDFKTPHPYAKFRPLRNINMPIYEDYGIYRGQVAGERGRNESIDLDRCVSRFAVELESLFFYIRAYTLVLQVLTTGSSKIDTFLVKQEGTRSENTLVSLQSFASWQLWTQTCCGGPGRHQAPNRLKSQSEISVSFFAHFGVPGQ